MTSIFAFRLRIIFNFYWSILFKIIHTNRKLFFHLKIVINFTCVKKKRKLQNVFKLTFTLNCDSKKSMGNVR